MNNVFVKEKLPLGWIKVKIEEISYKVTDGTHFTPKYVDNGISFISVKDIYDGKIHFDKCRYVSKETHEDLIRRCHPQANDLLITKSGTIGRLALVDAGKEFSLFVSVALIKCLWDKINSKYLKFYFEHFINSISISQTIKGGMLKNFHLEDIRNTEVLLPPLPEQHRIVAKIEELFSRLDAGIASLKQTRDQLKIYRQAVLKHAFEGKLTEKWRQQHAHTMEPAEKLLEKIKKERETLFNNQLDHWQKETAQWEQKGKQGKKPAKPKKPKELPPLTEKELKELPELPENWVLIKLGRLTLDVEYGTSSKSVKKGAMPVIRMGNIQNFNIDWTDLVYSDNCHDNKKYLLKKNDVLFNRTNSPELVGKTALYKGERKSIFAGYLIRINQIENLINAKYLNYYLNSIIAKNHGNKVKTDGVNQSNINGEKLKSYPIVYTNIEEQTKIVAEIESRLSVCDKLEETVRQALSQAESLRQSILKKAFAGKLVPQDPADEPAHILLERIRAQKEKMNLQTSPTKNKPKPKRTTP